MIAGEARAARTYTISIERIGFAVAAGGLMSGALIAGLVAAGGRDGAAPLLLAWLLGSGFSTIGIAAVAVPIWAALHALGWRGPFHAAATAAILAIFVSVMLQTDGVMLSPLPAAADVSLGYRWTVVGVMALAAAVFAAAIGAVMWRIAYRRTG